MYDPKVVLFGGAPAASSQRVAGWTISTTHGADQHTGEAV